MSETTTMLKVGATDLVLRMIEAGVVLRDHTLENPIRAIREISHDLTGRRKVRLANGREATALEIQEEYLARAKDFVESRGLQTDTVKRVLDLWERGLRAISSGDLSLVDRELDWVIKHRLIERYRAKHSLPLSSPRIARIDLAYHDIHRNRGLHYLLMKKRAWWNGSGPTSRCSSDIGAAADHPGQAARRLRAAGPGTAARLHGRLGAPEAERPGAAHGSVQRPVPVGRRAGGAADPEHVTGGVGAGHPQQNALGCSASRSHDKGRTCSHAKPSCGPARFS